VAGIHSDISSSGLDRLLICPASYRASRSLQLPSKLDTVTGTAAHDVHEWCLTTGQPAADRVLDTVTVEEHDRTWSILVDDVMASFVQESVDRINALPGLLWVERRVGIDMLTPITDQSGTADVIKIDPPSKTLYVVDYKHGAGVFVQAYLSAQLVSYALGALNDLCDLFEIDAIVLTIHQPRMDNWSEWRTTPAELNAIARHWRLLLQECIEPAPKFRPEKKACQFCAAKFTCPARAEQAKRLVQGLFDDLDEVHPGDMIARWPDDMPTIELLSVDSLVAVHSHAEQISGFLRDVKTHLLHLALHNEGVPGMKLIEGGHTRRKWLDDAAEREAANYLMSHGVAPSHVLKIERPSPAHAERMIPKLLRGELAQWWTKPTGRPQLVSSDDARPALEPASISMFDDLDVDEFEDG
jgi:Protein of unknown function (DUF2800)